MKNLAIPLFLISFFAQVALSQTPNNRGFTYFSEYENRLISDETLQKHVFSIGTGVTLATSEVTAPLYPVREGNNIEDIRPLFRLGVGYHYAFLKKKKLAIYSKERTELSGFGAYANIYATPINDDLYTQTKKLDDTIRPPFKDTVLTPRYELRLTYTNTALSFRGKMINFYFLHEFGLSFSRGTKNALLSPNTLTNSTFANIVPLSIKFGRRPIFFKSAFNFAFDNKLLQLAKIRGTVGFELQIYFYKTKK
ncbi:MAG: hypothetical protein AB8B72_03365 [Crocinitomicaceae bacterium]